MVTSPVPKGQQEKVRKCSSSLLWVSLPVLTGLIPKLLETKLLEAAKPSMTYNEGADLLSQCFLWFFPPFYDPCQF